MIFFQDYTKVDEYPSMFPQYSNKISNNPNVAFWELPGNHPVTVTEDVNGSLFNIFAGVAQGGSANP